MLIFKKKLPALILGLAVVVILGGCMAGVPEETTQPSTPPTTEPTTVPPTTVPPTTVHVHDYVETVTVEPSCTEEGYTLFECGCGATYTDRVVTPRGHTMEETVTEATAEEPGYTTHACLYCAESYRDTYTWLAETPTDFFDDAAFIGDSVSLALRNFNTQYKWLGEATFLCQGSYSVDHAVNNTMLIRYQGQNMTPQEALAACGANKVFILLGMNDIALYGVDKSIENWGVLVANIRELCPDITIYIQSGTPIYTGGQVGGLNNNRMDEYNARLKVFAEENGCIYLDVATAMKDDSNGLAYSYASDNYVHLTLSACELWARQLKNYVGKDGPVNE